MARGTRLTLFRNVTSPTTDHSALLEAVAAALTACQLAGLHVRLKHNTVFTDVGYVLATDDGWVARTLAYLPLEPGTD